MFNARVYRESDRSGVDALLHGEGGVQYDSDRIIVASNDVGEISGVLVWRAVGLIHEFRVRPSLRSRLVAAKIVDEAIRDRNTFYPAVKEAAFLIDGKNEKMKNFAELSGARKLEDGELFFLVLGPPRSGHVR